MKQLTCEMCGSTDLLKQDGVFVCQTCGMKYSVEEAKKMMIEGTVDVQGTVKVDNSAFVEKYLANARRAEQKEDWEETEKYYNMVEQNVPHHIESVFFSAYGKARLAMLDSEYYKRENKIEVLIRSISIISDCYNETSEDKKTVLREIAAAVKAMKSANYTYNIQTSFGTGSSAWQKELIQRVVSTFVKEIQEIATQQNDPSLLEILYEYGLASRGGDSKSKGSSKAPSKARKVVMIVLAAVSLFLSFVAFIGACIGDEVGAAVGIMAGIYAIPFGSVSLGLSKNQGGIKALAIVSFVLSLLMTLVSILVLAGA